MKYTACNVDNGFTKISMVLVYLSIQINPDEYAPLKQFQTCQMYLVKQSDIHKTIYQS